LWAAWVGSQTKGRDGNAKFTGQILRCVHEQIELLGLAAKPGETSTSPPLVGFSIIYPESAAEDIESVPEVTQADGRGFYGH
jgi:hypothetical protein